MYKYLKNNSLITCILWNQGYFGHFDYEMCFHVGGSQVGPHTLGGASVEITWQEGRLDEEYSKSHPDAGSHPEAKSHLEKYSHQNASLHQDASSHPEAGLLEEGNLHPEVDLHPEVNMLALADKELHPKVNMLALAI